MDRYRNRQHAGQVLAEQLAQYQRNNNVIVLALPRGGVPVAYEVAKKLNAPLDIFVVRKLGVPGHEELAMGAIASGGATVFNNSIITELGISQQAIEQVIAAESQELLRRERVYRGNQPSPEIENKIVILVDDGIATGATMRAAIKALKRRNPDEIIVAVPVADVSLCEEMKLIVDKFICPMCVYGLNAVGVWYDDFSQTEDEEVHQCLESHSLVK